MFEDLIDYSRLEEACQDCFGFSGVIFKRDFGPWKKNEFIKSLWFKLDGEPLVEETSDEGKIIRSCKFTLMPKE